MSRIFIDRPIFAWVIAIIIMLMGLGAIFALPVSQYPDVAPTQINIRATYPGANAQTIEGFFSLVKNGIRGVYHVVSAKWLQGYLNEYAWRYNHRDDRAAMFERLLARAALPLG